MFRDDRRSVVRRQITDDRRQTAQSGNIWTKTAFVFAVLSLLSLAVNCQTIPDLTEAELDRQSGDYTWVKVPKGQKYEDPAVAQSLFGTVVAGLPALLEFMGGVFEKESYEPLLEQKAEKERAKTARDLYKDFKNGKYPECVYNHLMASLLDIPPPNCTPWK